MTDVTNILLFQAFGEDYRNQAIYAIITLLNLQTTNLSFEVKIVTDNTEAFSELAKSYPVEAILIPEAKLIEWAKPDNYFFRRKIKAIQEIQYLYKANIINIDTDVLFLKKIDGLFDQMEKGNFLMHQKEWPLSYSRRKLYPAFLPDDLEVKLASGLHYSITGNTYMWNSGVVGIPYARRDSLDAVLELTDYLFSISRFLTVEQFAFALVFNQNGLLFESDKEIYHYYYQKAVANKYFRSLFSKKISLPHLLSIVKRDNFYFILLVRKRTDALYDTGRRNLHRVLRLIKLDFLINEK